MRKISIFICFLLMTFTLISCSNEEYIGGNLDVNSEIKYNGMNGTLAQEFSYRDSYFNNSATVNNVDLAKLSLAKATATTTAYSGNNYEKSSDFIVDFYNKTKFSNIYIPDDYKIKPSMDTMGYIIASKKIVFDNTKYLLVSIGVRGSGYECEWASNLTLGKEGNHQGFDSSSNKILNSLKEYLSNYNKEALNVKIWISGYSRGGAVASILGSKIIDNNISTVDNCYVYTFEAPASLYKTDKEYKNIFNYVNPYDFIPKVLSDKINIVRPGIDYDYTKDKDTEKVKEILKKINPNIKLGNGDNSLNVSNKILDIIYENSDIRNIFVDNYQDKIKYGINLIFSLDNNLRSDLLKYYQNKFAKTPLSILSKNGLSSFVIEGLDIFNVSYDKDKVVDLCDTAFSLLTDKIIGKFPINDMLSIISNISDTVSYHYIETSFAYINA